MLFGIVTGPSIEQAQTTINQSLNIAKGIEFRFDLLDHCSLETLKPLIIRCPLKRLFSLRPERQGGDFKGSEEKRWELLRHLCLLNPDYVDLEYDVPLSIWKQFSEAFPKIQWICSYHDFSEKTSYPFSTILDSMRNPYATIYKIAITPASVVQALELLHFVKTHQGEKTKLVGVAMGEKGQLSRVLGPIAGHLIDYAAITKINAPGQYTLSEMQQRYHYSNLNCNTAIYGLIGYPVKHSISDLWHNEYFSRQNRNAVYVKMPLSPEELATFIKSARQLPFQGLSVTMPLKEKVLAHLDGLAPSAMAVQAVNTIVIKEGQWIGHNTDGVGALNAFESVLPVQGRRLIVVGAGGTARAIIHTAIERGALVTVINRTLEKAMTLARLFQCQGGDFSMFHETVSQGYDGIINTTPDGECISPEWILSNAVAMDVVYTPRETPFLLAAAKKGCRLVYGETMFREQAFEQQRLWCS